MCGIIGGVHRGSLAAEQLGLEMLQQIRYRGPDAGYLHLGEDFFCGVRRLAIVNVQHGHQPTFSEDGRIVAVFNGEIYNHAELKRELTAAGHRVRLGSDAEVIPHAYQQWGLDFPSHFNGDFAIALFDLSARRVVFARDRLGIKPLYFTQTPDGLLFASEVKSLLVHPRVERNLNPQFLAQLFTFWTSIDGESPFVGIRQVEAGTVATFDFAGRPLCRHQYWEIPYRETAPRFQGTFAECQAAFREEFRKSVALRLQADVPVGTYTSGGIDSAVVNVAAYKDLAHHNTQTFSVAFEDQVFDESEYQQLVAGELGLKSNVVRCSNAAIYENLAQVIHHTESPIFRTAPVPMFLLSRRVAEQGVKVVLTGEGSDEITWGYDIFREAKLRRFWSRQPESQIRPQLFQKLYAYLPQFQNKRHYQLLVDFFKRDMQQTASPLYSHQTRIANSSAMHALLSPQLKQELTDRPATQTLIDSLPENFARRSLLEKCQYLEMRTLLQGYLLSSQGDRMLSAHGVEGRFPYLDHHVIEFLAGVPENFRLRGLQDKAILRETFKADLPPSIFNRPKFAFRAPELAAFVNDEEGFVDYHLRESNLADAGVFDPAAVRAFRYRLQRTPGERFSTRDNLAFVQILSTQVVHDHFVRRFDWVKARVPRTSDVAITRERGYLTGRAAA
jgi:asparagine synthase (glutamine-hydrolysing)